MNQQQIHDLDKHDFLHELIYKSCMSFFKWRSLDPSNAQDKEFKKWLDPHGTPDLDLVFRSIASEKINFEPLAPNRYWSSFKLDEAGEILIPQPYETIWILAHMSMFAHVSGEHSLVSASQTVVFCRSGETVVFLAKHPLYKLSYSVHNEFIDDAKATGFFVHPDVCKACYGVDPLSVEEVKASNLEPQPHEIYGYTN